VVGLVAMREEMTALGGDPGRINPLVPTELVIDHSVIADVSAGPTPIGSTPIWSSAATTNVKHEPELHRCANAIAHS
jgi:hypothetical protein